MREQHPKPRQLNRATPSAAGDRPAETPDWNANEHTLRWQGHVIKHFKAQAPYQEALLEELATQGWSPSITLEFGAAHPLHRKDRLSKTVKNLNQSVKPYLHFSLEGSATRLCWQATRARRTLVRR
jgi:hypothetical protein